MTTETDEQGGYWKVLFTLEVDTDKLEYTLGMFMCFYWPKMYHGADGWDNYQAAALLVDGTGVAPSDAGIPDAREISRFIRHAELRNRVDNKGTRAMLLNTPCRLTREGMESMVRHADKETIKRWREGAVVKPIPIKEVTRV